MFETVISHYLKPGGLCVLVIAPSHARYGVDRFQELINGESKLLRGEIIKGTFNFSKCRNVNQSLFTTIKQVTFGL